MPCSLKKKCARLAGGYAKDDYWSDLSEAIFGQTFSSARNQTLFSTHILVSLQKFFNLLYSISKIALSRYSRISYKKLNGYAREVGLLLDANFIFPAVTWKNIVWSFSMPLWCNKHLPGQSASIHCFEFLAVLQVRLFWGQIYNFCFFFNTFSFLFIFEKNPNEIWLFWPFMAN